MKPDLGAGWTPSDLDIHVPAHTELMMTRGLAHAGYGIIAEVPTQMVGYFSHVSRVVVVSNGRCKIDVVVSRTSPALSSIFQFHSTVTMNFVSADTLFCAYPRLILRRLSMLNAGPLYHSTVTSRVIAALQKYLSRGIRYISCRDAHGLSSTCKVTSCTLVRQCHHAVQLPPHPRDDAYKRRCLWQCGVLDVQWMLGGRPCGPQSA